MKSRLMPLDKLFREGLIQLVWQRSKQITELQPTIALLQLQDTVTNMAENGTRKSPDRLQPSQAASPTGNEEKSEGTQPAVEDAPPPLLAVNLPLPAQHIKGGEENKEYEATVATNNRYSQLAHLNQNPLANQIQMGKASGKRRNSAVASLLKRPKNTASTPLEECPAEKTPPS